MKGMIDRSGGIPLPESGVWTKAMYLEHHARSEAAKAQFAANGGGMGSGGPMGSMDFNRDRDRGRGPGGPGDWNGGGGGEWSERRGLEKKETEEERPVAMRYGKLPQGLPGWYDELDTDKDGQVALYEWRKGQKEMLEFTAMDLNGDGLVTADEYLRFARKKNIETKVDAFEKGERESGNWGLGAPLDPKAGAAGGSGGERPSRGGFGPGGKGGEFRSSESKGSESRGERERDREKKGNPWKKN